MTGRILVVDDEPNLREVLRIVLEGEGYTVRDAADLASASEAMGREHFDLVICDILLPDGSGLDLLRTHGATTSFAMITAHTTPATLLSAVRQGAVEYLSKPFDIDQLKAIVAKRLAAPLGTEEVRFGEELVGVSPAMRSIKDRVAQIARSDATVLLTGESGTGKELLARTIHAASPRASGPFLAVNCGALPEGLLESELFGHVRGAFTGAVRDKRGLFEEARGGTIFLDEIGELPLPLQVKLLRALQDRKIRPVGGTREASCDVRVMAATNADLRGLIELGRFREDLFFRINVLSVTLPPLRERLEDIPLLARVFLDRATRRLGVEKKELHKDVLLVLQAHPWPGNVRELENVIEQAAAMEPSPLITVGSLPPTLLAGAADRGTRSLGMQLPAEGLDLEAHLDTIRRELMRQALERCGGVQKDAARLLRMTYRAFRYHAEKLNLATED
ncbi:MAG TPA: sigma-54 dependent transcriptional regulator [Thermoanaerobaculaceae bacterium]|mgnify:CR=1 FL=1|nr:sigma-54 dependent transcriptional regulator [Thermoanaerobaculaceae bacterium]HRS16078.1 sigma-54 dependent transcriptional regulator [Thermoanaerobaculaceae bacterium]